MPTKKNGATPANQQKGKKVCTCCHHPKNMTDFYLSYSPMYSLDNRVPICKECCKNSALNSDGTINYIKLKSLLMQIDKPLYYDLIASSEESLLKENSYIDENELKYHGKEILQKYFTLIAMRQDRQRNWSDAESEGHMHQSNNRTISEKSAIVNKYSSLFSMENNLYFDDLTDSGINEDNAHCDVLSSPKAKKPKEPLIWSDEWKGNYTESDIDYLNSYYAGLERDYKIITENHRDYARKIAKASLQMDRTFDDMMNGVEGADKKYDNATKAFDTLSKSAKFSESTRSVNDVGISSFSKITEMVENHNWIPEHKPIEKDEIDKLLDYLSTIKKSL
jgi:hypothetical protein|nr:MAG TPA: His-Me finger endonuclease beta4-alpha2 domain [Caudoviricetes sp.]